jgi:hypothetical protein
LFRIDVGDAFAASISGQEAVPGESDLAIAFRPFSKALLGPMFDRSATVSAQRRPSPSGRSAPISSVS